MKKTFFLLALVALALLVAGFDAAAAVHSLFADPSGLLIAPIAAAVPSGLSEALEGIRSQASGRIDELQARLQAAEQHIAQVDGGTGTFGPGPSMGNTAAEAFANDPIFNAAADAARRQQKPGKFDARVNVDSSIRAALVGDSSGSSAVDYPVPAERGGIALPGMRALRLLDVLPSRPTTSDAVEYVQLNATGDASEQNAQGDTKAEINFNGDLQRAEIATIAGWTAASKQVLGDAKGLAQAIDIVIRHKVLSRLEHQLINGAGTAGKIKGLLSQAATLLPTIGTTPADIIGEAMVRQADAGYLPSLVLMNPLDWFRLQITRSTTENEYIFGSPTMPVPPALWNTRVITTPSVPEDMALTIDTRFTTVLDREQMSVTVSNSHSDFFVRNLVAILGELRAGLEVADVWAVYKFDLGQTSGP